MKIIPVNTQKEGRDFVGFPFTLYRNDPNWVPPLRKEVEKEFHESSNPFLQHAEITRFLCVDGPRVLGRIAGIVDDNYNQFHDEKTAFFGFFESVQELTVAQQLVEAVKDWAKSKGMERLRGPMNPSMNAECAFLLEGFDMPPVIMMPYNPPYYLDFMESLGFHKSKDLYAFYKDNTEGIPDRFKRAVKIIRKRTGVTVRSIDMKRIDEEIEIIKNIYNEAWEKNWGFVPMTNAEMDVMVEFLKPLAVPDLVLFAEIDDKPVGVSITLPDYNQVLKHLNGKLGVVGLAKFAYYRRHITGLRSLVFGVLKEYRNSGLHAVLYHETEKAAIRHGFEWCELSWNLEDNHEINSFDTSLGGRIYKKYRIYEVEL